MASTINTSPTSNLDCNRDEREQDNQVEASSPGFFYYEVEEIQESLEPRISILGKIITQNHIHKKSLQTALSGIWCNPKNLLVQEIESDIFQFTMEKVEDHKRIFKGDPWLFRNSWIIMQEWDGRSAINKMGFSKAPIWV